MVPNIFVCNNCEISDLFSEKQQQLLWVALGIVALEFCETFTKHSVNYVNIFRNNVAEIEFRPDIFLWGFVNLFRAVIFYFFLLSDIFLDAWFDRIASKKELKRVTNK